MRKLIIILSLLFAVAEAQITYTPMTAAGYQFKYGKFDSLLTAPFGDTAINRGTTRPGSIMCFTGDSLLYRWNGLRWFPIGDNIINCNSRKIFGEVISDSSLVFHSIPFDYFIGCTNYTAAAADFSLPVTAYARTDIWIVDTAGIISVLQGGASGLKPQYDPVYQFEVASVNIAAGASVPTDITNIDVYRENVEWVGTSDAPGVLFDYSTNPYEGLLSTYIPSFTNGQFVQYKDNTIHSFTDVSFIKFYVYSTAYSGNINISFYNDDTLKSSILTLLDDQHGFDESTTSIYQLVAIPSSAFIPVSPYLFNTIRFTFSGTGGPLQIDNVVLQSGGETPQGRGVLSYNGRDGHVISRQTDNIWSFDDVALSADTSNWLYYNNGNLVKTVSRKIVSIYTGPGLLMTDTLGGHRLLSLTGITPESTIQWSVIDSISSPILSPLPFEGSIFLVGTSATGAFATHENQIATYDSLANTYSFQTATAGDLLYNTETGFVSQLINGVWVRIGIAILHQFGDRYATVVIFGARDNYGAGIKTNDTLRLEISNTGVHKFSNGVVGGNYIGINPKNTGQSPLITFFYAGQAEMVFGSNSLGTSLFTADGLQSEKTINSVGLVSASTVLSGNGLTTAPPGGSLVLTPSNTPAFINFSNAGNFTSATIGTIAASGDYVHYKNPSGIATFDGTEIFRIKRLTSDFLMGTTTDDTTILFNVASTIKGVRFSPMTAAQRLAINLPANGLLVYDLDSLCYFSYTGSVWVSLCGGTVGIGGANTLEEVVLEGNTSWKEFGVRSTGNGDGTDPNNVLVTELTKSNYDSSGVVKLHYPGGVPEYVTSYGYNGIRPRYWDDGDGIDGNDRILHFPTVLTKPSGDVFMVQSVNGIYADAVGEITISGGDGLANLYLKDSSLSSDRTVDLDGNILQFNQDGRNFLYINPQLDNEQIVLRSFNNTGDGNIGGVNLSSAPDQGSAEIYASFNDGIIDDAHITLERTATEREITYAADKHTFPFGSYNAVSIDPTNDTMALRIIHASGAESLIKIGDDGSPPRVTIGVSDLPNGSFAEYAFGPGGVGMSANATVASQRLVSFNMSDGGIQTTYLNTTSGNSSTLLQGINTGDHPYLQLAAQGTGNTSNIIIDDTAININTPLLRINGVLYSGGGGGDALTSNPLSQFAATTSAQLASVISDEEGTDKLVFNTSPTLVTPILGVATATSINKVAITAPATSATLTIADGKTLTVSRSLTLTGTDATTMTFPTTSATIARTDLAQTFTGTQTFGSVVATTGVTQGTSTTNYWNAFLSSLGATVATTEYKIGSPSSQFRVGFRGNTSTVATGGNNIFNVMVGAADFTEATTSTSPLAGNLAVLTPTMTNGAGATTDFQAIYAGDAPTGGTNNWSINAGAINHRTKSTWDNTTTTVGTTGNQTINKSSGTVNIAAAGTTVTVTNSLVSATSLVFAVIRTNDTTARISNVVPAAGSFVINIVACTAEVSIGFFVIN